MGKTDNTDGNLRREDPASTADIAPGTPIPGGQIGPYRLLQVLGEGGFATVYLAQQHEPVRREVALKIVKPGMDSQALIARFQVERQALALLNHPGIARVFDAGATESGRPYFVMEYVKGVPITEHCDRHRLSVEERLHLFVQVCEAVQHAHQKGIIHRDLKPSNILVSFEDGHAVPKVIDFGIAKTISQPLTERTLHTEMGQLMGTPEYMSPEQAERTGQDIDTRSDVYSLGVVLYELLTGSLPFESETLRSGGIDRFRQVIREQDPKTPSTRLKDFTGERLTAVAQQRRVDCGALGRTLRGDLDWITLKAMDKDRTRRYGAIGELIADIDRHLRCEPVVAGPPSAIYRLRKFVRRNRAFVTGLAAVLVVLLAGIAGTTSFAVRAERQGQVSRAVADFLTRDLLGLVDPNNARGQEVSVKYILDGASRNLEGKFKDEPLVEAMIRQTLGDTYAKLGEWKQAQPHFERILEVRRACLGADDRATLAAMDRLARLYAVQARYDDAVRLIVRALEIRRRVLGQGHPETLASMLMLGNLYLGQGRADQATPFLEDSLSLSRRHLGENHPQTVAAICGIANLRAFQGQTQEAESLLGQALEIQDRLGNAQEEHTLLLMQNIAFIYLRQSRHQEAEAIIVKTLDACRRRLGDENPITLNTLSALGLVYQTQQRYEEAARLLLQAADTSRRVFGAEYPLTTQLTERLGSIYREQGRYDLAEPPLLQHYEDRRQRLGENHPSTIAAIKALIHLYDAWGKPQEAQKWRERFVQAQTAR